MTQEYRQTASRDKFTFPKNKQRSFWRREKPFRALHGLCVTKIIWREIRVSKSIQLFSTEAPENFHKIEYKSNSTKESTGQFYGRKNEARQKTRNG